MILKQNCLGGGGGVGLIIFCFQKGGLKRNSGKIICLFYTQKAMPYKVIRVTYMTDHVDSINYSQYVVLVGLIALHINN